MRGMQCVFPQVRISSNVFQKKLSHPSTQPSNNVACVFLPQTVPGELGYGGLPKVPQVDLHEGDEKEAAAVGSHE